MEENSMARMLTAVIRICAVAVFIQVAIMALNLFACREMSLEAKAFCKEKGSCSEKPKPKAKKKLVLFESAMERGFLKSAEVKYAVSKGWVYLAEIRTVSGEVEWVQVAIPKKKDRERYARHWETSRIQVVLLEDILGPVPSIGMVVEAQVHYGPPRIEESDASRAYLRCKRMYLKSWNLNGTAKT